MNVELKAMLTVIFALAKLVKDLVEKSGAAQDVADLTPLFAAVPSIVANFSDLEKEVVALEQPANLADLLSFVASQFVGIDSDAKAQAIVNASLKLVSDLGVDGVGLYNAIKG